MPRPRTPRASGVSACENRSNTRDRNSGAMPRPVSVTTSRNAAPTGDSASVTRPPSGVNFTALDSRFHATWRSRSPSADIHRADGSMAVTSSTPRASAAGRTASSALWTTPPASTGSMCSRNCPLSIRDRSSSSSTRRACACALRSITLIACSTRCGGTCPLDNIRAQPRTALRGVRNSCEMVARKSSFIRMASANADSASF